MDHAKDIPPAIHAYKAARHEQRTADDALRRAFEAELLRELRAHLVDHAGHDVAAALHVELHPHERHTLHVKAPHHIPVMMRHDEKGALKFGVLKGRGVTWFDHLADALLHGQPLKFASDTDQDKAFDTAKPATAPATAAPVAGGDDAGVEQA